MGPEPGRSIDLNADVGEQPSDLELVALVTSANVACGGHAGDRSSMLAAVGAAVTQSVVVGAHPSYPDPGGFGRVELGWEVERVARAVVEQVARLAEVAASEGAAVRYVKLHGALYHRTSTDRECAAAIVEALSSSGLGSLAVLAEPGAAMAELAARAGWLTAVEGFCDRAYGPDGRLVDRRRPGAVLEDPDEAAEQALSLALAGGVRAVDGSFVALSPDSLCLHGDSPGAAETARRVRAALERAGVELRPFVSQPAD